MKSFLTKLIKLAGWIAGVTVAALLLDFTLFRGLEVGAVAVPLPTEVTVARLDQGWSDTDSAWNTRDFHHMSQGTKILPYTWFMALDEPTLDPIFRASGLRRPSISRGSGFSMTRA